MDENNRRRRREDFKREAEASWKAYQETGRHLTGEEVRAWLRTWGTPDELPLEEWHKRVMSHMKQMSTDEDYRREVAKRTC